MVIPLFLSGGSHHRGNFANRKEASPMSLDAVHGFIAKANTDNTLAELVTQSLTGKTNLNLVELAGKHGFVFTEAEGLQVWNEVQAKGELSDTLLDAVAGGHTMPGGNSMV